MQKKHTQVNRQDDPNVIRVSVLRRTIGYVAARPLRYRPRIFNDCPGWGDRHGYVPRQAQVVAPERCEVAGDSSEIPDKPPFHAGAVIPLRRIFDTCVRGQLRFHRSGITGRVRCRIIIISCGPNTDNYCRLVSSAALPGARDSAPASRPAVAGAHNAWACQYRYKAIFMIPGSAARSAAARQHRQSGPARRRPGAGAKGGLSNAR